mmetsp:Transcript_22053/g.46681  ORF Transcript_22053/g.46681 Transcript_22053/m.46681 type:complete len:207 (+) Transcript_22053:173-793(+)
MGTSILSPAAPPFQPSSFSSVIAEGSSIVEFAIFNNGVPSSVFYGIHPEHEVLQHIADEAIDETFPPTAEDVAEMEAAEEFVEFMAWLAFLDECDERARFSFSDIKKRWEARRAQGLVGKPHRVHDYGRGGTSHKNGVMDLMEDCQMREKEQLVPFVPRLYEDRPINTVKFSGSNKMVMMGKNHGVKKARGVRGHGTVIHQPRKHN